MKRTLTTLFTCIIIASGAMAQTTAVFKKASVDPVIDGVIDAVWGEADPENNIALDPGDDGPTLGEPGETTWQGLWTNSGLFILLRVTDDAFYPHYAVTPAGNTWKYDKPELYFDVNYELVDGGGPLPEGTGSGNGHYQITPAFTDGSNDGTMITMSNGVDYAFMVTEPNYLAEYYIPFSILLDENGEGLDKTAEIGFDVTIIDRDPGDMDSRNAVWANPDTIGSWTNMDQCGIITLEGATTGTYIETITLTGGNITDNNGQLQIEAEIFPADASNTFLNWSVANGTGRATIDSKGVVTAISNGDVTVTGVATDGSWVDATAVVNISNQIVSVGELNVIKNPNFDQVNGDGTASLWGGWGGEAGSPMPQVVDGIAVCTPTVATANVWQYSFSQNQLQALPNVEYSFSFKAWADDTRTFNVDFEDTEANAYNRYGSTKDSRTTNGDGRSDWTIDVTAEPTTYTFDVTFDQIRYEDPKTDQKVSVMLGTSEVQVYLDSFVLVVLSDLDLITDYEPVVAINVTGADGASNVALGATLQMIAEVLPAEADHKDVKWSVLEGTGEATIDETGLLSPVSAGTVTVIADAVDDSYVSGELPVTISWASGVSESTVHSIKLYPNPAVNELNVVLSSQDATLAIFNSIGMKLDEVIVEGIMHTFDISDYASGIYFIKSDEDVVKFVKQ